MTMMRSSRMQTHVQIERSHSHSSLALRLIKHAFTHEMLRRWVLYAGVAVVAAFCYHNAAQCDLVFDDVSAVSENRDVRPHTPLTNLFFNDFWGTPIRKEQSHKSYRPLCVLTFRLNFMWHQLSPAPYHITNVLLHVLVCLLFFRLCCVLVSGCCAFLATLLFAVHPVHTEAVTGVVGRAELLSSIFFLAALLLYIRATHCSASGHSWLCVCASVLCVSAAMLCKEQGVTVVAVCLVYDVFVRNKLRWRGVCELLRWSVSDDGCRGDVRGGWPSSSLLARLATLLTASGTLLAARLHVMGAQLPVFTKFDNPASAAEFPTRHLTYFYLLGANAWLLLCPNELCCDWTMGTVPLVTSGGDPRLLAPLLMCVVMATLLWRALNSVSDMSDLVIMSLSMIVLPFLPASNLLFPVGFVLAERVLYMPSMGWCLLVAAGCCHLLDKLSTRRWAGWAVYAGMFILLVSGGCRCVLRNADWRNELSLFSSGLRVTRHNAKLYNNVGHALESRRQYEHALRYFSEAVSVQPDDVGAHINVGRTLNHLQRYDEAETAYRQALSLLPRARPGQVYETRLAPGHLRVFLNLAALVARNTSRLPEADELYRRAIRMRADYTQAYINRGDVLLRMNRTSEALTVYHQALEHDNTNPDIYYNLGVVHLQMARPSQALVYLEHALSLDPDHQQALLNSALVLLESGDRSQHAECQRRLLRLLQLLHNNHQHEQQQQSAAVVQPERVYFNLALLASEQGNNTAAELFFRKAVEWRGDFVSALFNLALLLCEQNRPLEAVPYLTRLISLHSGHVKALVLLADININVLNDLDHAEQCYHRIIQLEPDNIQARHNLCVVYVQRNQLNTAEQCLEQVLQMAPHEQYISTHLRIVRTKLATSSSSHPTTSASTSPHPSAST